MAPSQGAHFPTNPPIDAANGPTPVSGIALPPAPGPSCRLHTATQSHSCISLAPDSTPGAHWQNKCKTDRNSPPANPPFPHLAPVNPLPKPLQRLIARAPCSGHCHKSSPLGSGSNVHSQSPTTPDLHRSAIHNIPPSPSASPGTPAC